MSQEQLANVTNTNAPNTTTTTNSNILSDIIQATGIMPSSESEIGSGTEKNSAGIPMQEDNAPVLYNDAANSHNFNNVALIQTNVSENSSSQKHLESPSDKAREICTGKYNSS